MALGFVEEEMLQHWCCHPSSFDGINESAWAHSLVMGDNIISNFVCPDKSAMGKRWPVEIFHAMFKINPLFVTCSRNFKLLAKTCKNQSKLTQLIKTYENLSCT